VFEIIKSLFLPKEKKMYSLTFHPETGKSNAPVNPPRIKEINFFHLKKGNDERIFEIKGVMDVKISNEKRVFLYNVYDHQLDKNFIVEREFFDALFVQIIPKEKIQ